MTRLLMLLTLFPTLASAGPVVGLEMMAMSGVNPDAKNTATTLLTPTFGYQLDMAIVDMSRWTERSRGRRWCAPMRLSGGEARVLEWLPKRHRRSFEETRGASSARAGQVCKF